MPPRITITDLTGLKPKEANFVIEFVKDFAARRAAEASGYSPDYGHKLMTKDHIQQAIDRILEARLETSHIDAEWVLMEAVDNHMIARQQGNITASNTALSLVAKHTMVDAMASDKLNMNIHADKEITEKLMRGRQRLRERDVPAASNDEVDFF